MDYFFFYVYEKYLQFKKHSISWKKFLVFSIKPARSTYSSELFSYLNDMYRILKTTGKIILASVLRILQICEFLNFAVIFTNQKINFSKFSCNCLCKKINFSQIHHIISYVIFAIHSFNKVIRFGSYQKK